MILSRLPVQISDSSPLGMDPEGLVLQDYLQGCDRPYVDLLPWL